MWVFFSSANVIVCFSFFFIRAFVVVGSWSFIAIAVCAHDANAFSIRASKFQLNIQQQMNELFVSSVFCF